MRGRSVGVGVRYSIQLRCRHTLFHFLHVRRMLPADAQLQALTAAADQRILGLLG